MGALIVGCIFGLYFYLQSHQIIKTKRNTILYFSLIGIFSAIIIFILSFILVRSYKYKLLSELEETWEVVDLQENPQQKKKLQVENTTNRDLILQIPVTRRTITSPSPETMRECSNTQSPIKKTLN